MQPEFNNQQLSQEVREIDMPDYTEADARSLERAHQRIDEVKDLLTELKIQNKYLKDRVDLFEKALAEYNKNEVAQLLLINKKIDDLTRYKWIVLGVLVSVTSLFSLLSSDTGRMLLNIITNGKVPP